MLGKHSILSSVYSYIAEADSFLRDLLRATSLLARDTISAKDVSLPQGEVTSSPAAVACLHAAFANACPPTAFLARLSFSSILLDTNLSSPT